VHSKAVRKPLVAIILHILSTMFYSRTINICHKSGIPWVTASVRRPRGGGAEPTRPPLNQPLMFTGVTGRE